jgi:hypothetical protein
VLLLKLGLISCLRWLYRQPSLKRAVAVLQTNATVGMVRVTSNGVLFSNRSTIEIIRKPVGGTVTLWLQPWQRSSCGWLCLEKSWFGVGGYDEQMLNGFMKIGNLDYNYKTWLVHVHSSEIFISLSVKEKFETSTLIIWFWIAKYIFNKHKDNIYLANFEFYIGNCFQIHYCVQV